MESKKKRSRWQKMPASKKAMIVLSVLIAIATISVVISLPEEFSLVDSPVYIDGSDATGFVNFIIILWRGILSFAAGAIGFLVILVLWGLYFAGRGIYRKIQEPKRKHQEESQPPQN